MYKSMDRALHGPGLYCEWCGYDEVLSPCYFCQNTGADKKDAKYCRGCSNELNNCIESEKCQNLFFPYSKPDLTK